MQLLICAAVLFAAILLTTPHAQAAETFPARVVGVVDGDTLRVSRKERRGGLDECWRRKERLPSPPAPK